MSRENHKAYQVAYYELGSCLKSKLEALKDPSEHMMLRLQECMEKCRESADSITCYQEMATLYLDFAEIGICCDSASLQLYESQLTEEFI